MDEEYSSAPQNTREMMAEEERLPRQLERVFKGSTIVRTNDVKECRSIVSALSTCNADNGCGKLCDIR